MIKKGIKHPDKLIIRCPNWVGDIVMAIPALDCFRQNFPDTKIIGIIKKNAQGILRDGPWFDGFIDCNDKSWSGFWNMAKQIKACKADMAVLLTNSVRSALSTWMGGVFRDATGSYDIWWWVIILGGALAALFHLPIKERPVARLAQAA